MLSEKDIDKAVALIEKRFANRQRFFEQRKSPEWIRPLWERGLFRDPPPVQRQNGYIQCPPWPESRYLAKMAEFDPQAVIDVIESVPETENHHVLLDFVSAALKMPGFLAVRLVPRLLSSEEIYRNSLLAERIAALAVHLAKEERADESLILVSALLDILPDPDPPSKVITFLGIPVKKSPKPRSQLETQSYRHILLKYIPTLAEAGGIQVLQIACDLLNRTMKLSQRDDDESWEDEHSYIWHEALEDMDTANHRSRSRKLAGVWISAVRDASERLLTSSSVSIAEIVNLLQKHSWLVFRRLQLHLVRRYGTRELVADTLLDKSLFDNFTVQHEYQLLLKEQFGELSDQQKRSLLDWIWVGVPREKFSDYEWSDKERDDYNRRWQFSRLQLIEPHLTGEDKARYTTLKRQQPEIEIAPTIPPIAELRKSEPDAVIHLLKTWIPQGEPGPSLLHDLAGNLSRIVKEKAVEYSRVAELFQQLDKSYINAALRGFADAAGAGTNIHWESVLGLAMFSVVQDTESNKSEHNTGERESDRSSYRQSILRLLEKGFDQSSLYPIPFDFKQNVWDILSPITDDPDPKDDENKRYEGAEAYEVAINSIRSSAVEAVIRYAGWCFRNLDSHSGFNDIPEAQHVLELHLHDPSPAVRSVYGVYFPCFLSYDESWASEHVHSIFPDPRAKPAMWYSAWDSFVIWREPYVEKDGTSKLLSLLKRHYRHAFDHLGSREKNRHTTGDRNPDARLAEHLMVYYGLGVAESKKLLDDFFQNASEEIRAHALVFAGQQLSESCQELAPGVVERLTALWTDRVASVPADKLQEHSEEIASFRFWFSSGQFDDLWALKQLEWVLVTLPASHESYDWHEVVERFHQIVENLPLRPKNQQEMVLGLILKCLKNLIEHDHMGWEVLNWEDYAEKILRTCQSSKIPLIEEQARQIVERLLEKGYWLFKPLLDKSETKTQ